MAIARGESQICELSSFSGEFLPRGRSRVHLVPFPICVPHRCSPREISIARKQQVTGDGESAFCGPKIATGAFRGTAPFTFFPFPKGEESAVDGQGIRSLPLGQDYSNAFRTFPPFVGSRFENVRFSNE